MVTENIRGNNILDLFNSNHTVVNSVVFLVFASFISDLKPKETKQKPAWYYCTEKADWDSFKSYLQGVRDKVLEDNE